jgi:DNA-binding CsgD family transcriptional regulator
MHTGELEVAGSVLDAAIVGEQGGNAARRRLVLLQAWSAMLAEQPERARGLIALAVDRGSSLPPRDQLLWHSLEVGLARRSDDAAALLHAWQRARESLLHVPVDLFSLLPLGELIVAAARLRDSVWLETHLAEAWSLLEKLGDPPVWSVMLRWSAVQAGILLDRPADLAPHAAALVRASGNSRLAAVLSAAGREWITVLAGEVDVLAVELAAKGLASAGLPWDGSRLAGHAAARAVDRRDMSKLLSVARDLHPRPRVPRQHDQRPAGRDATGLSQREKEVARLVLEGMTYREIGDAIFVSPRTAEHHIAQIRRRLGAANRSDLLAKLRTALGLHDVFP